MYKGALKIKAILNKDKTTIKTYKKVYVVVLLTTKSQESLFYSAKLIAIRLSNFNLTHPPLHPTERVRPSAVCVNNVVFEQKISSQTKTLNDVL